MDDETSIAITNCTSTPTGSPAAGDRSAASAIAATTIRQPSAALPAQLPNFIAALFFGKLGIAHHVLRHGASPERVSHEA
jgi:hypothetical protein